MISTHHELLLKRLYGDYVGGKYTYRENLLKRFPKNERNECNYALNELIAQKWVIQKPPFDGEQICLNRCRIKHIKQIINPYENFKDSLNSKHERWSFTKMFDDKMNKNRNAKRTHYAIINILKMLIGYLLSAS